MITRLPQTLALKRQLLAQSNRRARNAATTLPRNHAIVWNANHDSRVPLQPMARFFSAQPGGRIPIFEVMGSKLDQLIQDSQWLIPRKGSGEFICCHSRKMTWIRGKKGSQNLIIGVRIRQFLPKGQKGDEGGFGNAREGWKCGGPCQQVDWGRLWAFSV